MVIPLEEEYREEEWKQRQREDYWKYWKQEYKLVSLYQETKKQQYYPHYAEDKLLNNIWKRTDDYPKKEKDPDTKKRQLMKRKKIQTLKRRGLLRKGAYYERVAWEQALYERWLKKRELYEWKDRYEKGFFDFEQYEFLSSSSGIYDYDITVGCKWDLSEGEEGGVWDLSGEELPERYCNSSSSSGSSGILVEDKPLVGGKPFTLLGMFKT